MGTGTESVVAAIGAGLGAGRAFSAFCVEPGAGATELARDLGQVWRRARISAISSGDDGRAAALWL